MFQTFSGSSRRPRQVNLSGQNPNPFAASSWNSAASASGAQKTVAHAQQEREQRQREREKLNASKKIQRVWRGHRTRIELADARRRQYQMAYNSQEGGDVPVPVEQLQLLVAFCDPAREDDTAQLTALGGKFVHSDNAQLVSEEEYQPYLFKLAKLTLSALVRSLPSYNKNSIQAFVKNIANSLSDDWRAELVTAAVFPLEESPLASKKLIYRPSLETYSAMASKFLTTPDLEARLGGLQGIITKISISRLAAAIVSDYSNISILQSNPEAKLWLLAHFIAMYNLQQRSEQEPELLRALSLQLSACSVDIIGRIDAIKPTANVTQNEEGEESGNAAGAQLVRPLPVFISTQLMSLLNQDSIAGLLRRFNIDYIKGSTTGQEDASLLASYALTLLRIFPDRADEIRMWLCSSTMKTSNGNDVLALKFFWQAMSTTRIFKAIMADSQAALEILRYQKQHSNEQSQELQARDREWRTILLFLELYTFVLKFIDDEDFLGGSTESNQTSGTVSKIRGSALPLEAVEKLTLFLKNISFTTYYNAAELSGDDKPVIEGGLGTYFSVNNQARKDKQGRQKDDKRLEMAKVLKPNSIRIRGGDDEPVMSLNLRRVNRPYQMRQQEMIRRQQQKLNKRKLMAAVGPRIEVLQNMPFVIPFETRVEVFRQFVMLDQLKRRSGVVDPDSWRMRVEDMAHNRNAAREALGRHHAQIRRDNVFEDAFATFNSLGEGLKEPIQITFVDSFGSVEAGIDGGGVTKEFLTSVTNEAFHGPLKFGSDATLFVTNDQNLLYPNPTAVEQDYETLRENGVDETDPNWRAYGMQLRNRMNFLGRIVGKCLYEGILIDINFAGFFLLKWSAAYSGSEAAGRANLNDLHFSLDFTITDTIPINKPDVRPKIITRDLIPNGSNIPVTNENRLLYIAYVVRHRLHIQPYELTQAFLRGLGQIINPSWLSMFNQAELQTLISGETSEIDVNDLRENTQYGGVYSIGDDGLEHPTVVMFWEVMEELEDEDRRRVLKYVTSTPRAPLLGFSQLNPLFSIRDSSADEERLPSASTCVNLLKLPRYQSKERLREKLLYAVRAGAGFDLS
ncbi:hypothetical protein EYC84_003305 [Monilinia fructicola]|uniref:HECT-type E3 ubiquitin transferase n=1 Tax=Monilinia fructicola TaxID=38448 RepID=A0A5M9K1D1_MONFR|nr:hypothetical protein EYC84_003305 [Monilinia fructicola]